MGITVENSKDTVKFIINGPFAVDEAAYFRKEAYRFWKR